MLNDMAMALDWFMLLECVSVIASFDNNPIYNQCSQPAEDKRGVQAEVQREKPKRKKTM